MINLSVVVPFYNEKENLEKLHVEITKVLTQFKFRSEIIYIDDGSTDEYLRGFKKIINSKKNHKIENRLIRFRRNFGQTAATSAGIDYARGKLISFLDADLQNDPDELIKMHKQILLGYEVVLGWRSARQDKLLRSFTSRVANLIIRKIFKIPYHDVGCSLKIVKKEILKDIKLYGEYHRVLPVILYWKGAKIIEVPVNHRFRKAGKSKYNYTRILKLIIDLITIKFLISYQTKPAYVFGTIGLGSNLVGVITLIYVTYQKLFLGIYVYRNPLFTIAISLILLGVQFILMGLLAELLVRIYFESQKKPIYDVKDIIK